MNASLDTGCLYFMSAHTHVHQSLHVLPWNVSAATLKENTLVDTYECTHISIKTNLVEKHIRKQIGFC